MFSCNSEACQPIAGNPIYLDGQRTCLKLQTMHFSVTLWHYHSIGIGIMMKQIIIGLDPSPSETCLVPMGYTNISWTETVRLCGTPCGFNSSSNTADTSAALGKIHGKTRASCRSIKRFGFFWMANEKNMIAMETYPFSIPFYWLVSK